MPELTWYPAQSADSQHDDQETDLDAIGSPGGASWAWVALNDRWTWSIYARWLWEDIDADPASTLAEGEADTPDAARAAVTTWVRNARLEQET